jgi:hypothetical protein
MCPGRPYLLGGTSLRGLARHLERFARHVIVLRGGQSEKQRSDIAARLAAMRPQLSRFEANYVGYFQPSISSRASLNRVDTLAQRAGFARN